MPMPDVEAAWAKAETRAHSRCRACRLIKRNSDWAFRTGATYSAPCGHTCERDMAAVRDAMLAAYDAGALAERRYGRWRRPYMMDEKRARIQALGEPR